MTTMPHNLEAEQALLGILLFDHAAYENVEGVCKAEQFYEPFHQRLFGLIETQIRARRAVTPALLASHFKEDMAFSDLGGIAYLSDLADRSPITTTAGDYAAEVARLGTLRELVRVADGLRSEALKPDMNAAKLITRVEAYLADVARGAGMIDYWETGAALADALSAVLDGAKNHIPSGFDGWDERTGGFRVARMTVEAGRPGMGKTALAVQRALNMAKQGIAIGFQSLEIDREELALRLGAAEAFRPGARDESPDSFKAQMGKLTDLQKELMARGGQILRELPIYFDDRSGLTPGDMIPASKRLIRKWEKAGLKRGLLILDHLHMVKPDRPTGNRVVEVGEVSAAYRDLAKQSGVPVLALCQLSRANEDRKNSDKEPQMSDLRWSGEIEADANTITFIHRPEVYLKEPDDKADLDAMDAYMSEMDKWRDKALLKNVKNRGGPSGVRHVVNVSLPHNAFWE